MPTGVRRRVRTSARVNAATRIMAPKSTPKAAASDRRGGNRDAHLLAAVADRQLEQLVGADLGLVADHATDLREIRNTAPHVLERASVDLLVGHELDRRAAARDALDALGEVEDGDLLVGA